MSLEPIPENWMDLLENDDTVQKWHRETDNGTLPTDSVQSLISYIEYYYKEDVHRMIGSSEGLPQSFVHWWCHICLGDDIMFSKPDYPAMTHWHQNIMEHHPELYKGELTEIVVLTVMATWLDLLLTDMILFENERPYSKIPRLYCGQVVCTKKGCLTTRVDTMQYIMDGGRQIFRERGFKGGEKYWTSICEKYK
jgi:hypothetical protein